MALTPAGLKAEILSARAAAFGPPDDSSIAEKDAQALAMAVITYLIANGVVLPTALLSAAPGSPVTGTGTLS